MSPEQIDDMFRELADLVAKHGIPITITIEVSPPGSAAADATTQTSTA